MSAYQTYWMRYQVDLESGAVTEIGNEYGDVCIPDMSSLVSEALDSQRFFLDIEEIDLGKYKITEFVSGETAEVMSPGEIEVFCREITSGVINQFDEYLNLEVSEKYRQSHLKNYRNELEKQLKDKIDELWTEK